MDVATFYGIFSGTCFTLVGLWWNVVQARDEWFADERLRRLAGGVYLSFLYPGLMGLFAQINPENPFVWRSSFAVIALLGIVTTARLIRLTYDPQDTRFFRRNRWLVVVIYALILVFGVAPGLARVIGFAPLQVAATLLILLIVLAHGLTWEFLTEAKEASKKEGG